ncbi:MAG: hypothetical protein WCT42_03855 [Candidatus Paceibacterota bacterium]
MNSETKIHSNDSVPAACQNCKKDFIIEPDDFSFYEKIKVPPPTFCSECRFQRRIMFKNEMVFNKRECDLCGKSLISICNPENIPKVFCHKCWWSDKWDTGDYYLDYDSNKNFFEQLKELQQKTPFEQKITDYATVINSDYINYAGSCKNCYLIFNADFCENVYYSSILAHVQDSADLLMASAELSYGSIDIDGSRIYFSENCSDCINIWYCKNCIGCNDCFGCMNLIKKNYYIYNQPYTKEEYNKKIKELELHKYSTHLEIKKIIYDFWKKFPHRYMYGRMNKDATGDYVFNSKNAKDCYQGRFMEDSAYCQFVTLATVRDCYDLSGWGNGAELCVDSSNCGEGVSRVNYSVTTWANCRNVEYGMYVINCNNCFGCLNLRKKEYCILNKQYTKEEYFTLRDEIIASLEKNPYIDRKGRVWKYGEFIPYDVCPFSYNESVANQYFPLNKDEIENLGFSYTEPKKPNYQKTIEIENIPDSINDISDNFVDEIIQCSCGKFYKIAEGELQLLKRFGIPIPRQCFDCRHMIRIRRTNLPYFYNRVCDKCGESIRTSYSPDRLEIIYCEKCYQQEVY